MTDFAMINLFHDIYSKKYSLDGIIINKQCCMLRADGIHLQPAAKRLRR